VVLPKRKVLTNKCNRSLKKGKGIPSKTWPFSLWMSFSVIVLVNYNFRKFLVFNETGFSYYFCDSAKVLKLNVAWILVILCAGA